MLLNHFPNGCATLGIHAKLASAPVITNLKMNVQACFKGLNISVSDAKGPFISTEILGK